MIPGLDKWQTGFFLCAVVVLLFQMFAGWRRGLMRQLFYMLSILIGYLAGVYGGRLAVPILRPLGYPDFVTAAAGGVVIGLLVMLAMSLLGALILKKTSQQSVWVVRFFYGVSGALTGGIVGLFFIWLALLGTRVLGTVAESELHPHTLPPSEKSGETAERPVQNREPSAVVRGLADLKHSIDQPPFGTVADKVDPIPPGLYSTLDKIVRMVTDGGAMERFTKYPGSKPIVAHPAVVALTKDPEITEAIRSGKYLSLINNKHLVEAANNPEIIDLVKRFNLEKALDYALTPEAKKAAPGK